MVSSRAVGKDCDNWYWSRAALSRSRHRGRFIARGLTKNRNVSTPRNFLLMRPRLWNPQIGADCESQRQRVTFPRSCWSSEYILASRTRLADHRNISIPTFLATKLVRQHSKSRIGEKYHYTFIFFVAYLHFPRIVVENCRSSAQGFRVRATGKTRIFVNCRRIMHGWNINHTYQEKTDVCESQ